MQWAMQITFGQLKLNRQILTITKLSSMFVKLPSHQEASYFTFHKFVQGKIKF